MKRKFVLGYSSIECQRFGLRIVLSIAIFPKTFCHRVSKIFWSYQVLEIVPLSQNVNRKDGV